MKMRKKGIAMTFNWIFAIVAGGFILFLAIFAAGKFIRTSEQALYTETAASLISLFDPLETGLASGKAHEIGFKKQSKVFFECQESGNSGFGKQRISFSEKTLGDSYSEPGGRVSIKDKYIFAESVVEGKTIYVFSKPFFMGFKVNDLAMVISAEDNYCFYDASEGIKDSLEGLNLGNIIFMNASSDCNGINVCFAESRSSVDCQIRVDENQGYVLNRKEGKIVYYVGELIYPAIFSSPDIYECNVKRMKFKFDQLAGIYLDKIDIIEREGCSSNVGVKLASVLGGIDDSRDLIGLYERVEEFDSINSQALSGCQLW